MSITIFTEENNFTTFINDHNEEGIIIPFKNQYECAGMILFKYRINNTIYRDTSIDINKWNRHILDMFAKIFGVDIKPNNILIKKKELIKLLLNRITFEE